MRPSRPHDPESWNLTTDAGGRLSIGTVSLDAIAAEHGTPVHVVHQAALERTARRFLASAAAQVPGTVSTHYAFKCNAVPGVIAILKDCGLKAEVMTPAELTVARRLGFTHDDIIVNGPSKTHAFLAQCLRNRVRFIVVDSLPELARLMEVATLSDACCDILLRVNPDIIPTGMNAGSATGSRSGCAFGLDVHGGEVERALSWLRQDRRIRLAGFHLHLGTGLRVPTDYIPAVRILRDLVRLAEHDHFAPHVIDLGGGFCTPTSREFTSTEMLLYEAVGRLPLPGSLGPSPEEFFHVIGESLRTEFGSMSVPEIILEPGRSLVSAAQMLLVRVEYIKERPGVGTWAITDGGLGTVSMPTYYEYHEIFPCSGVARPRTHRMTILGPGCFAGDVVYRNKLMPAIEAGEVLAIMDSGAYFTALESNFGHPRPAIVAVSHDSVHVLRRRESVDDMMARDGQFIRTEEVQS